MGIGTAIVALGIPIMMLTFGILVTRDEKTAVSKPKQQR